MFVLFLCFLEFVEYLFLRFKVEDNQTRNIPIKRSNKPLCNQ